MKELIKEKGFIVGNVYFSKDYVNISLSEEYKEELLTSGVVDLIDYIETAKNIIYEKTNTNISI